MGRGSFSLPRTRRERLKSPLPPSISFRAPPRAGRGVLAIFMTSRVSRPGVTWTVTYKNFRVPQRYHSYKKRWFIGSLVLTQKRIMGFAYWKPILNIPLDDPRLSEVSWSSNGERALCATFEAGLFFDDWSGLISCCFFTELWARFLSAGGLAQRAGGWGGGPERDGWRVEAAWRWMGTPVLGSTPGKLWSTVQAMLFRACPRMRPPEGAGFGRCFPCPLRFPLRFHPDGRPQSP